MKHERRRAHVEKANARAAWRRSLEELLELAEHASSAGDPAPRRLLELIDDEPQPSPTRPRAGRMPPG
jgi:hypothetical protein